jgi:hypothetical protein
VLGRQADLDVTTLEAVVGAPLTPVTRKQAVFVETAAHRKTFLTVGIVNAAFIYAMRALGPASPALLAGIVAALSTRT